MIGRLSGTVLPLVALSVGGCAVSETISTGSYRVAVAEGAVTELQRLGFVMDEPPDCDTPPTGSPAVVRIVCTGRTAAGNPVKVTGIAQAAHSAHPRERYVIAVAGAPVLRKSCLGRGCAGGQFAGKATRPDG